MRRPFVTSWSTCARRAPFASPEPAVDESPLATLRRQYENYLEKERGLAPVTVAGYWHFIRRFLVERFGDAPIRVRELVPDDISRFLLRHARSGSPKVARLMVTALRSFFRFLFRHGETESDLAGAVPTVPEWRLAEVPKYLDAGGSRTGRPCLRAGHPRRPS